MNCIKEGNEKVLIFKLPKCNDMNACPSTICPHLNIQPQPLSDVMFEPKPPIGTNPFR